jgi:hypothetical protein
VGERRLGHEVVGQPVREPGKRIGGQRRDHEEIRALKVRVWISARLRAGERVERLRGDEALRPAREQWVHIVSRLHEQADELAGLVGRDAAGDADKDPRHAHIVPSLQLRKLLARVQRKRPGRGTRPASGVCASRIREGADPRLR